MLDPLLRFSLRRPAAVGFAALALLAFGLWSAGRLSSDIVPDISPVQVQVLTAAPALAAEEIETSVTRPVELEMAGLPGLQTVRSLTRFGISQVALTFADGTDVYLARQLVTERLAAASARLPAGLAPRLAPPSTGLGEIFTYALRYRPDAPGRPADERVRLTELKATQDFVVRPALRQVPGVAEVNTTGGYDRQMVVEPDPEKLAAAGLDLNDLADALAKNLAPGGGALLERGPRALLVRSGARAQTVAEVAGLTVKTGWGATPVLTREVAEVRLDAAPRFGAATVDGEEAVLGTALMLPGENGRAVARRFAAAVRAVAPRLPAGIELVPLADRSLLVDDVLRTVRRNLAEGAALVVLVLLVLLGNARAALIVAAVLPLAFLLGLAGLAGLGGSGNLMSLGAIDFGLLADGAIVLVENSLLRLGQRRRELGREPDARERAATVLAAAREVAAPTVIGVVVITLVWLPIFGLDGVEGKMFRPLATVAVAALVAALALTLTLVPTLCAGCLRAGAAGEGENVVAAALGRAYQPALDFALRRRGALLVGVALLALAAGFVFSRLGTEFLPRLDEGSLVVEVHRPAGGSLAGAVAAEVAAERAIRAQVPEATQVFSRLGRSDLATDPQSADENDLYVALKPRREWRRTHAGRIPSKDELAKRITEVIAARVPGQELTTNQPVALRFDELLEGTRADVAIKVFGPGYDQLDALAAEVKTVVERLPGAGEVAAEEVGRADTLEIVPDRDAMRRLQATAAEVDGAISTALMGREVGRIDAGEQFYPLAVRFPAAVRDRPDLLASLPFRSAERNLLLNVGQVAQVRVTPRLATILRENGERRRAVMVNVRGRDSGGFAREAQGAVRAHVHPPAGYRVEFSGGFERYRHARARLRWLTPAVLAAVFALAALALGSGRRALAVLAGVPLAWVGGVFALAWRGMPLTISAVVGFLALSGVAVLNGLVLAAAYGQLRRRGVPPTDAARESARRRLRPVLGTALVAGLGLLPMALSTAPGAEVQRPLATVVIGGILSATALTLLVIPALLAGRRRPPPTAVPGAPENLGPPPAVFAAREELT